MVGENRVYDYGKDNGVEQGIADRKRDMNISVIGLEYKLVSFLEKWHGIERELKSRPRHAESLLVPSPSGYYHNPLSYFYY